MRKVLKCGLFFVILFLIINVISYFLLFDKNVEKFGLYKIANYSILSENKNSIDAVVIGDSLIYSSVSPMEIWHNYGYSVYDCASAAQLLKDSYDNLKVALENQDLKVVFLEANVLYRNPKNKSWYFKVYNFFSNSFPIFRYHNNWKELFLNNVDDLNNSGVYKGFKYVTKVKPAKNRNYMKVSLKKQDIPSANVMYFEKIVKLCEENNVKLVLISTPSMKNWSYSKHMGAKDLAEDNNVSFIDLNLGNVLNINWNKETKDNGDHLNYNGAVKVSNYIGEYLKGLNIVTDHRNDSYYSSWNDNYIIYSNGLK